MINDLLDLRKTRVPIGYDGEEETPAPEIAAVPSRPAPITPNVDSEKPPKAKPAPIGPNVPSISAPINPKLEQDKAELQRLQTTGSGLSQLSQKPGIGHKIGAVFGRIGDIAGTAFFPSITAQIPGTELHHQVLVNQAAGRVANDLKTAQSEAQTANLQAMPELRQAQFDLKRQHEQNTQDQAAAKLNAQLAQHGFKRDENGAIVPLPYNEMSEDQQAVHDLKAAQHEMAEANTAYKKAQKDNIPLAMQMAQQRIETAQHNAAVAAGRLGLSKDEFERDTFGTFHGEPIPGAPTDNQGHTIGTKVAPKANGLTQSTRTMVEAAPKVREFVTRINQLIDEQEKTLGPASSRWSEYMAGKIGAPNPEFTKLRTDVGLLQTLLMRMHVGSRGGEYIMKHFQDLLDSSKQSPANMRAALQEIDAYAKEVAAQGGGGEGGEAVEEYVRDPKTGKLVKK